MSKKNERRINIKVRNNIFLQHIEDAGYKTVGEFCRKNKLQPTDIGEVISMKRSPLLVDGSFRNVVIASADILKCSPENLFSEAEMNLALKNNKHCIYVQEAEMKYMTKMNDNDDKLLDEMISNDQRNHMIDKILAILTPRERDVIIRRYGLINGQVQTLEEIANDYKITKVRVRHVEMQALKKLRASTHAKLLKEFF